MSKKSCFRAAHTGLAHAGPDGARRFGVRLAGVAATLALVTLLAGCSGSTPGSTSASSTDTAVSTDDANATDPPADDSTDDQDSADDSIPEGGTAINCKQLKQEDVQPLLAGAIESVSVSSAGDDGTGQQCDFAGGVDDLNVIDVLVLSGSSATTEYSDVSEGGVSVPGVGDKAVRAPGEISVNALHGDTYCSVSVGDPGDVPGIADFETANEGSSDIPDAIADPAAAALGTLCNRIFGTGTTTPDLAAVASAVAAVGTVSPSAAPTS